MTNVLALEILPYDFLWLRVSGLLLMVNCLAFRRGLFKHGILSLPTVVRSHVTPEIELKTAVCETVDLRLPGSCSRIVYH